MQITWINASRQGLLSADHALNNASRQNWWGLHCPLLREPGGSCAVAASNQRHAGKGWPALECLVRSRHSPGGAHPDRALTPSGALIPKCHRVALLVCCIPSSRFPAGFLGNGSTPETIRTPDPCLRRTLSGSALARRSRSTQEQQAAENQSGQKHRVDRQHQHRAPAEAGQLL